MRLGVFPLRGGGSALDCVRRVAGGEATALPFVFFRCVLLCSCRL